MTNLTDLVGISDPPVTVDPFGLCRNPENERSARQRYLDMLANLKAEIAQLEIDRKVLLDRAKVLSDAQLAVRSTLRSVCEHEEYETTSEYFEGGYNDLARTIYTDKCKCCNLTLDRREKTHSWYG
jgi:hypothetical protein